MQDLVPWPRIEPRPSASGACSHWNFREVPGLLTGARGSKPHVAAEKAFTFTWPFTTSLGSRIASLLQEAIHLDSREGGIDPASQERCQKICNLLLNHTST